MSTGDRPRPAATPDADGVMVGRNGIPAVRVAAAGQLRPALDALGLRPPRPTVVVVGGAAGLSEARMDRLHPLFADVIAPALDSHAAVGVDGGTRFGVMRLFGEARAARNAVFPLVGVVADGPLQLSARRHDTILEPHHTHFVVVPGESWGAEAPWIARTATAVAGRARSVTVLINGGQIAYSDVRHSIEANRPVVVIAGSGGAADVFAGALAGAAAGHRVAAQVGSGLVHAVSIDEPAALAASLAAALGAR